MKISRLLLGSIMLFVVGTVLQLIWPLAQPASYHHFADERSLGALHNASDVLSNVVILIAGLLCLDWVRRHASNQPAQFPGMVVAAFGLVLTAFGSAYYHMTPTDATLVWDRLPMTIVFAGILAMLWTSWSGRRVGWPQLLIMAVVSPATVGYWLLFNSLWPYAILQFGGLAFIIVMTLTRRVDGVLAWTLVIVFYGVAKIFESLDWQVWELTRHVIAGHALKHVSSGLAGASLILVANAVPRAIAGIVPRRPGGIGHSGTPR
ncbi:ceramidase [Paraburkholderia sp. ZP32-5]|uniref:ceramidase n=1 Tax=Paraburkholderia sp. ZP32-5 TaxID=2883245 RepID=UPI001F22FD4B|nr:ceramidase [Paraburkholderia sp. ZP32-5]